MIDILECGNCEGTGRIDISSYDGHKGGLIGEYETRMCTGCEGHGVLEKITRVTFVPYKSKVEHETIQR